MAKLIHLRCLAPNKPSQREFYSLKGAHKIPCLGRYTAEEASVDTNKFC